MSKSEPWYVGRRAELLAEEFFWELGARFVADMTQSGVPIDHLAFFTGDDEAVQVIAVEVKSTETPVQDRFPFPTRVIARLQRLNIPSLLLVVDVKHNEVYFAWGSEAARPSGENGASCPVRVRKATEVEKAALRREIATLHAAPADPEFARPAA